MIEFGSGGDFTVTMEGPFAGSGGGGGGEMSGVKLSTISAPVSEWKGGTSPYSQVVKVDGITLSSKVDIQLSVEQMEHFHNKDIAFTTENENGVITLYAIGDKPDIDMEIQNTVSDALLVGGTSGMIIRGNTVSTNAPRTDLHQTDPSKADYFIGREAITELMEVGQVTLQPTGWVSTRQTVAFSGVLTDTRKQAIVSVADPDSMDLYLDCDIRLVDSGDGTLTFSCEEVPSDIVKVNILILTKGVE